MADTNDLIIPQSKGWSRVFTKVFWKGVSESMAAERLLDLVRDDFTGKLLDVSAGTATLNAEKYSRIKKADITALVPTAEGLPENPENVKTVEGFVEKLPFEDASFDIVLSFNGFNVFPDKEEAHSEILRVLKPGGRFVASYYVRGKGSRADWLVGEVLAPKRIFIAPFESEDSLRERLEENYKIETFEFDGPRVRFLARKKKVQA